jgi:hypothetical protein
MVLPLFVVCTTDSEGVLGVFSLWNEIPKELVNTRLTKYSKTAFAIQMPYQYESPKLGLS